MWCPKYQYCPLSSGPRSFFPSLDLHFFHAPPSFFSPLSSPSPALLVCLLPPLQPLSLLILLSLSLNFLFTMAAPAHTFKVADIVCILLDDEPGQLLTASIHSPWLLSVAGRLSSLRLRCLVSWPSVPSTVLTSLLPVLVSPVVFT